MSKLFEAMEEAHRNRHSLHLTPVTELRFVAPSPLEFEVEMLALYRALHHHLRDLDQKVILFLGVEGGEGVSTVVSSLARVAAERLSRKVAVLDANILSPTQHQLFGIDAQIGWDDALKDSSEFEKAIYPTSIKWLSIVPMSVANAGSLQVIDARSVGGLFVSLKQRFDLILVDCAPPSVLPDSITLTQESDGVVLVIATDTTPWPAADTIRRQVTNVGGNVIGVVLNKQKLYRPKKIRRSV